ncbi:MAG TPA: hypothetical protein DF613_14520 [Lachnospiraceae bacterium]|nr:hypothetical protein [Lachnospiraceae bacterium]
MVIKIACHKNAYIEWKRREIFPAFSDGSGLVNPTIKFSKKAIDDGFFVCFNRQRKDCLYLQCPGRTGMTGSVGK